jgi:hypothetical protein
VLLDDTLLPGALQEGSTRLLIGAHFGLDCGEGVAEVDELRCNDAERVAVPRRGRSHAVALPSDLKGDRRAVDDDGLWLVCVDQSMAECALQRSRRRPPLRR